MRLTTLWRNFPHMPPGQDGSWGSGCPDEGVVAFQLVDEKSESAATTRRRLASPVYWRYYFAFSAPGNVLSEDYLQNIIRLAAEDRNNLAKQLLDSVTDNGVSSRTWFEHILTRLPPAVTLAADPRAREGLLAFIFGHADEILPYFRQRSLILRYQRLGIAELTTQLIVQMLAVNRSEALTTLQEMMVKSAETTWTACYFRDVMWLHGAAGHWPGDESERFLSAEELELLRQRLAENMLPPALTDDVAEQDDVGSYLWSWRDIAGVETLRRWGKEECSEDRSFLLLLLCLRSYVTSTDRGRYLRLDIDSAEKLIDQSCQFRARLNEIAAWGDPLVEDQLSRVQEAVRKVRN